MLERPPRWLIAWGAWTVGGSVALLAIAAGAILFLYRSGTWTHDQVDLWGPILIFAVVVVPNAISLVALRRLAKRLQPPAGKTDEPARRPM